MTDVATAAIAFVLAFAFFHGDPDLHDLLMQYLAAHTAHPY